MTKRKEIYRSRKDKVIAGVCGGIAEYTGVESFWVRIIFIVLTLMNGLGILVYLIWWALVPENPKQRASKKTTAEDAVSQLKQGKVEKNATVILGTFLVLVGVFILFDMHIPWFDFDVIWPLILIALGIYFLEKKRK